MRSQLVVLGIVAALASCTITAVTFSTGDAPLAEDCSTPGDEDGNGLADCADPACAGTPACMSNLTCGNGIVDKETGEECDPGAKDSATCNSNLANQIQAGLGCKTSKCGDVYTNPAAGEECDKGRNTFDCNGNDNGPGSCKRPSCGDGYINPQYIIPLTDFPEQCDNPGGIDTKDCNGNNNGNNGPGSCQIPSCGDGYINTQFIPLDSNFPEQCDAGGDTPNCNGNNGPGSCQIPKCGDGYMNPQFTPLGSNSPEQCDNSGGVNTKFCNGNNSGKNGPGSCQIPKCGDGYLNPLFTPPGASRPEECEVGVPCGGAKTCNISICNCF